MGTKQSLQVCTAVVRLPTGSPLPREAWSSRVSQARGTPTHRCGAPQEHTWSLLAADSRLAR